jgi:poly(ribitol-phosphate) beta-N-acetylglucosaminyltransferase
MVEAVPDVSVIVPAYNGLPYIEQCLESLVGQTIGLERMQVIVVDDGSTDGTPALLDRFAAEYPSFTVVHQANFGRPAGPRNAGMKLVRGRYTFFLDQDDYLSEDALEASVRAADTNGTDVVLARIKGIGGRSTPRSMFTRTIPRADVFATQAYWTLNPMKLFRTEMVRRLGLEFDERVPYGEDEEFVARAYLEGAGITILADKDYVFWRYRDDLSNITTSVVRLEDRLPAVRKLFDMVAGMVPAGPRRDKLMRRHFRVELVTGAFEGYRTERDPAARAEAFTEFKRVVDAYYTDRIDAASPSEDRVLMHLVREGRAGEFGEYLDALASAGPAPVVVEGEHVYLALPWFRQEGRRIPDELFDVGPQLKPVCQHHPLVVRDGEVAIDAICRLAALSDRVTGVSFVARRVRGGQEVSFPLAFEPVLDETRPFVVVRDAVPVDALLGSVSAGDWDLSVRLSADGISRDRRIVESSATSRGPRMMRTAEGASVARSAVLEPAMRGNLRLYVTEGAGPRTETWLRMEERAARMLHGLALSAWATWRRVRR